MRELGLIAAFFGLALMAGPVMLLAAPPAAAGGLVLVISPPWSGGAARIVVQSGGQLVGPDAAPFARFATSEGPKFDRKLREAGAWAVLDGTRLAAICGV